MTWPIPSPGFELQQTGDLSAANGWMPVEADVAETPLGYQVELSLAAATRYFRLVSRLNHVLVIGQSLAAGAYASDILSPTQPFQNKMFIGQRLDGGLPGVGVPDFIPEDLSSLIALHERWDPKQSGGETIASGFANWVSQIAGPGAHDLLMSNAARGGSDYSLLQRAPSGQPTEIPTGTYPYLRSLDHVQAGRVLAGAGNYRFQAILVVHGEGDHINQIYDQNIRDWQSDYEADIRKLTGQTNVIPMFHTQISAWGNLGNATRTLSPFKVLDEYKRHPEKTILVGPKYIFPYQNDGLHLTSPGYRWLGEYYAKAYHQHVIRNRPWSPLHPLSESITRSNNVIEITFAGVVGRLVLDTNLVSDPNGTEILDPNGGPQYQPILVTIGPFGFEYRDNDGAGDPWKCSTWITDVALASTNKLLITLNQSPRGAERRLRYAATALGQSQGGRGGPEAGPRGCLRDEDPAVSRHGHTLYNWCVHFDESVP